MTDSAEPGDEPRTLAQERVTDGLLALDTEWRVTYLDEAAERLLRVDAESLRGEPVWESLPTGAHVGFKSCCLRARDRGEPVEFEQSSPTDDARLRYRIYPGDRGFTVRIEPVADAAAETSDTDFTARSLTDAAVTIDTDGVIQEANSGVAPVFGYEPAELVGEPLTTLVPEWLRDRHESAFQRYLETGEKQLDWRDVELPGRRKDGEEVELSISFAEHGSGDERRFTGVFRDISERKEREWALQQASETFSDSDVGFDEQVRRLLELGCSVLDVEYGTLSRIQGEEYRFDCVVAPDDAAVAAGDTVPLSATNCERVVAQRQTLALQDVARDAPRLAERAGNADLGIAAYLGVPVVVEDEAVGTFCFFDVAPREEAFTDWEVTFAEHLGQWVAQTLEQRRYVEQLQALNEINGVVHEVADSIIQESTREEIERRVCEALAATDSYLFAWIGQPDPGSEAVTLRAEAGVEGYLDDVEISVNADSEESQGPTGRALQTGEVQTLQRVGTAPEYEPWTGIPEKYGFQSSAAVPIVHEGTSYGVLNLYTERPDAFEGQEREMIELLGKIVGHAIAAAERRQALLAESMIELELRTTDVVDALELSDSPTEPVEIHAAVPRSDDEYVLFGRGDPDDRSFVEALVANHPHWADLVSVAETGGELRFEALATEPPFLETLASAGGQLERAVFDGVDLRMEIQLGPQAEVRRVLDTIRDAYPSTSLVSKQEVSTTRGTQRHGTEVALEELTDRQLETLRTAYYAGYFDWPRAASGEEVAELLDISAPTFSQHLRSAEQAVFAALFDDEPG